MFVVNNKSDKVLNKYVKREKKLIKGYVTGFWVKRERG